MKLAPIILFVYNRPEHTERTLESLMANELANESDLFIFADGPKKDANAETIFKIEKTIALATKKKWCKNVTLIKSETNKGLANSVIDGVSKVITDFDKVIVLEDDLVVSPFFLKYMNNALDTYESKTEVACISAYIYPVKDALPATFFIKGADCWGWATWKHSWDIFERDGAKLLKQLEEKNLSSSFDFEDSYGYVQMLKEQIEGKNNSWAIRWYASAFLENKYCLYPGVSLVQNIGIDGSGTHSGVSHKWDVNLSDKEIKVLPLVIEENAVAKQAIINYFRNQKSSESSLMNKWLGRLRLVFKR